ncbi:MAG: DUF488 domain-containing protein [Pseudorhodoplanes sp.]
MKRKIQTKRVYEPPSRSDGTRILVDRIWPRGISKAEAALDGWIKDVAPSAALRKWFGHEPERWTAFKRRYTHELDGNPQAVAELAAHLKDGTVTLVYAARDPEQNNAAVLRQYLLARKPRKTRPSTRAKKAASRK